MSSFPFLLIRRKPVLAIELMSYFFILFFNDQTLSLILLINVQGPSEKKIQL